jgi:Ni,Fe-hydrogenase maturation factor
VLDAVAGVDPGTIVRLPIRDLLVRPAFVPRSSHELPIDLVVGLAEIIREAPIVGTFVGLGGHVFDYGAPVSRAVRAAIPAYGRAIAAELESLTGVEVGIEA